MKIVLASNNVGKVREIQHLFSATEIVPQSEYAVKSVEETGLTFVENAILKARYAAQCTGLPTIADDSGLCVQALNYSPGIYSARYAGANATDRENLEKLLDDLQAVPAAKRDAYYVCILVYLRNATDPLPKIFQGVWHGTILSAPQGKLGFGYDPIFFVPTQKCSAAELPLEIKNNISHRGQALQQLAIWMQTS